MSCLRCLLIPTNQDKALPTNQGEGPVSIQAESLCWVRAVSPLRASCKGVCAFDFWVRPHFCRCVGPWARLHGQGFGHRQGPQMTLTAALCPKSSLYQASKTSWVDILMVTDHRVILQDGPGPKETLLGDASPCLRGRKVLTSCVALSKLVNLSDPYHPPLWNGGNKSTYLLEILYRLKKIHCAWHNVWHMASTNCSVMLIIPRSALRFLQDRSRERTAKGASADRPEYQLVIKEMQL